MCQRMIVQCQVRMREHIVLSIRSPNVYPKTFDSIIRLPESVYHGTQLMHIDYSNPISIGIKHGKVVNPRNKRAP